MACSPSSCSGSLLANGTYQVYRGETFRLVFDTEAEAFDAFGEVHTNPAGGTLVDAFDVEITETQVEYTFPTAGIEPGVYYFDCWYEDQAGVVRAFVGRQGLVISPSVHTF